MSALPRPGDVLRGMQLEPHALCVGRARLVPDPMRSPLDVVPEVDLLQERVEAELLRVRDASEREGYEAGLREGRAAAAREAESERQQASAQAQAELEEEREAVRSLATSMATSAGDVLHLAEDDMVALCFEVLCRVLGESVPPEEAIRAQLRVAARQLPPAGHIAVHVHPADAELLAGCVAPDTARFRWVADPDVILGGCVVKHAGGGLDLRFETALHGCREALSIERARRLLSRSAA